MVIYPHDSDDTIKLKHAREDGVSPVGRSAVTMDLTIDEGPELATVMRLQEPSMPCSARALSAVEPPATAESESHRQTRQEIKAQLKDKSFRRSSQFLATVTGEQSQTPSNNL